jgi:DsbC/DsbD-like thiol-disulfide interchange protein
MLLGLDEHLHGETGHRQYAARGHLKATAKLVQEDDGLTVTLGLAMAPGWHINAHQPRQDYLIPTTVSLAEAAAGWRLDAIEYPGAEPKKLGFENQLLALYQGNLALRAHLVPTPNALARDGGQIALELRMQACNDRACLPPETLRLDIPLTLTQDARASAAHGQ